MGWFQKGLNAAGRQAQRVQFEADKAMRVRREEAGVADLQNKTQAKLAELGQAALLVYEKGGLQDPAIAAVIAEIVGLKDQLAAQEAKLQAVKAEQWQEEGAAPAQPAAPAQAPERVVIAPVAEAPQQASPPAVAECPSCHTPVRSTAAFCPECGTKLK